MLCNHQDEILLETNISNDYHYDMHPELKIHKTCIACDLCRISCPEKAILTNGREYCVDHWNCTLCGICIELCPIECIKIIEADTERDIS